MYYMETGSTDPYFNLAFEEYVLTHRGDGDYLLLWQNENTIVVGRNQNTLAEINRPFVEAHGIRVVRRGTGGGAVYHDLGNLNYSFITDAGRGALAGIARFTRPVVEALQGLGLRAEASGRNDILVEGRKVSGTAQQLSGGRILHHGTLLFDSDMGALSGALRVDPEKFRSKAAQSVRGRVGNIRDLLPADMDLPAFWAYLRARFSGGAAETGRLTDAELAQVRLLRDGKYASWAWNYGRSPQCSLCSRRYWDGGCLEVRLSVEAGRIAQLVFYGDFLSLRSPDELAAALRAAVYERAAVSAVLSRFPIHELFGSITADEVLATILAADA